MASEFSTRGDGAPVYEPVWCHHCGVYSFHHEWGTSGLGFENDTCPECGDAWPPSGGGPLEREPVGRQLDAALKREQHW